MLAHLTFALLILPLAANAGEADFRVEDAPMSEPPSAVAAAVQASQETPYTNADGGPCVYEGKRIDLDGDGTAEDWVLTTRDACSWAASAAPVWLVRNEAGRPRVVLQFITYSLTVGTAKAHGLRHIATARSTAARTEEQLWKFDGQNYRIAKNRVTSDQ